MFLTSGYYSLEDLFWILATLLLGLLAYFKWTYKHWKRKQIPYLKPKFPFGNLKNPFGQPRSFAETCQEFYTQLKEKECEHGGVFLFQTPMYMPVKPELVRNILSRDCDYFIDRGVYYNEKSDPLSAHLAAIEGSKWKNIRAKLTPTFSSGKMKLMFPMLIESANQLKNALDVIYKKNCPVDIKDASSRFTTNIIGSCAYGIECNCFQDEDSQFIKYGKRFFDQTKFESLKGIISLAAPKLAKLLGLILTPEEVTRFFISLVKNTVEYREDNNFNRKDFMQLLIDLKNTVKDKNGKGIGFTIEEIAAQAFLFFIAGFDTSSTTMTFSLFELALQKEIQEKVREEIADVLKKHDGEITYDALADMKYMGQVIDETLRKYPPLAFLNRVCVKEYKFPDRDLVLEKGTPVLISLLGLHRDPDYYPEPEMFDPNRFSSDNKSKIVPFTYLPFGEGPRQCLGLRFGIMQTKIGLTMLLKNFKFSVNEKTKIPIEIDPVSFILAPAGSIWLNVERISQ